MFCKHCGKETIEGAVVCLSCGHLIEDQFVKPNQDYRRKEGKTIATLSIVFGILGFYPLAFIGSIIGVILASIGLSDKNNEYKGNCKIGLIISLVTFFIWVVFIIIFFIFLFSFGGGYPYDLLF
jgi:uncharacterized membrane protein YvbJ